MSWLAMALRPAANDAGGRSISCLTSATETWRWLPLLAQYVLRYHPPLSELAQRVFCNANVIYYCIIHRRLAGDILRHVRNLLTLAIFL
jgi:hypothetical protein